MSGLLDFYGIKDWFVSLSAEDQQEIVAIYGEDDLFEKNVEWSSAGVVKFLGILARNAFSRNSMRLCYTINAYASGIIKTSKDREDYETHLAILERMKASHPNPGASFDAVE